MKKIFVTFLILCAGSLVLMSTETTQEDPFASLMGVKWGVTAVEFKTSFKYKVSSFNEGFYIDNFPFGDTKIEQIRFVFKPINPAMKFKFKEKNYSQFVFNKVAWNISPDQFETILEVFKKKYGEPSKINESKIQNRMGAEFNQIIVRWESIDRLIQLFRYANQIDQGFVTFLPKSDIEQLLEKKDETTDKAADIL